MQAPAHADQAATGGSAQHTHLPHGELGAAVVSVRSLGRAENSMIMASGAALSTFLAGASPMMGCMQ